MHSHAHTAEQGQCGVYQAALLVTLWALSACLNVAWVRCDLLKDSVGRRYTIASFGGLGGRGGTMRAASSLPSLSRNKSLSACHEIDSAAWPRRHILIRSKCKR